MAKHYGENLRFERDAVIIQKYKNFLHRLKSVNNKHTLLNSWVVEAYISIRLENGYIPEEKHG